MAENLNSVGVTPDTVAQTLADADHLIEKVPFGVVFKEYREFVYSNRVQKGKMRESTYRSRFLTQLNKLEPLLKSAKLQEVTSSDWQRIFEDDRGR